MINVPNLSVKQCQFKVCTEIFRSMKFIRDAILFSIFQKETVPFCEMAISNDDGFPSSRRNPRQ